MANRNWSLGSRYEMPTPGRRAIAILLVAVAALPMPGNTASHAASAATLHLVADTSAPVGNFSDSINRLVELVALAGSGLLALVWARVALSWFSNDITKKIQAKDRARDALVGTLVFMAAVTGLLYGLAHWVLTGS